jgi:hypothetical protein
MTYWWPRVKDVDVCKPYTYLVEWDAETWWALYPLMGDPDLEHPTELALAREVFSGICDMAHAYARHLVPPVFIRGCTTSGKHDWDKTCYFSSETLKDRKLFDRQLINLVEDHETKFWLYGGPLFCFAVREFIPSVMIFSAFDGNLPITKERRLFYVKDEGIVCNHPYWPKEAIRPSPKEKLPRDWEVQLEEMNYHHEWERRTLETECNSVGRALVSDEYPAWSIDFLYGADGNWYLIDCAVAKNSYHWEGCESAETFK